MGGGDPGRHQGSAHAQIPPDQCGPRLGLLKEGLTLKRCSPPVNHMCIRIHTGTTMVPVPPAPAPKPHHSVLPCMSLGLLSCHSSTRDQVSAHERVSPCAGSTGGCPGFQLPFSPSGKADRVLNDFHYQMPCELLFLAQDPWAGTHPSSGGSSATEVSLQVFNHHLWAWG